MHMLDCITWIFETCTIIIIKTRWRGDIHWSAKRLQSSCDFKRLYVLSLRYRVLIDEQNRPRRCCSLPLIAVRCETKTSVSYPSDMDHGLFYFTSDGQMNSLCHIFCYFNMIFEFFKPFPWSVFSRINTIFVSLSCRSNCRYTAFSFRYNNWYWIWKSCLFLLCPIN